jgi:16S rRNA (guanine(527)-N(7))-methyltransferase RsmG
VTAPERDTEGEVLDAALRDAGLPDAVVAGCCVHFRLLRRWNQTHNLTRITTAREAATRHYLDCALPVLAVLAGKAAGVGTPAVPGPEAARFIDVGSGAGFPGLVVSLLRPTAEALLVEPSRKRGSFLQVAATALQLPHVRVVAPATPCTAPWVVSRATFSRHAREELWRYVDPGGTLWVWTTPAEQSTWKRETATWGGVAFDWFEYALPDVGPRAVALLRRAVG